MTKPSNDGNSLDEWSSDLENVDMHFSSGPNNRMFFFLSSGASSDSSTDYYSSYTPKAFSGIGPNKAFRCMIRVNGSRSSTSVTWTCMGGAISSSGLYSAPSTTGTYIVKATRVANTSKSVSVTVNVISDPTTVTVYQAGNCTATYNCMDRQEKENGDIPFCDGYHQ